MDQEVIMSADSRAFSAERQRKALGATPEFAAFKLLIDIPELAHLTSLSVRALRRMDSARDIPGRVRVGRRVLFQTEIIREWVRAGLPSRDTWNALQECDRKR
jgi:predicted DNA-binding transcriptional regulator AlpA